MDKAKILYISNFRGINVATIFYNGQFCWLAKEIDKALRYSEEGYNFYDVIRKCFFVMLKGEGYETIKREDFDDDDRELDFISKYKNHLVLYQPGLSYVCKITDELRSKDTFDMQTVN